MTPDRDASRVPEFAKDRRCVLMVEPDSVVASSLMAALQNIGHPCARVVATLPEAIEHLRAGQFATVVGNLDFKQSLEISEDFGVAVVPSPLLLLERPSAPFPAYVLPKPPQRVHIEFAFALLTSVYGDRPASRHQ